MGGGGGGVGRFLSGKNFFFRFSPNFFSLLRTRLQDFFFKIFQPPGPHKSNGSPLRVQCPAIWINYAAFLFFAPAHKPKFGSFLLVYFLLFTCSLLFPCLSFYSHFCCLLYRLSFVWNFGWLSFPQRYKFNLQRVLGK